MRLAALSSGLADKAVSLLYEPLFRSVPSDAWTTRCKTQMMGTLDVLEADRRRRTTPYWLGHALTHADISFTCTLRFVKEAHPGLFDPRAFPALEHQADVCEALEPFRAVYQPIVNNL
jgi:glutathione S-transferase